jgi:hypothetical protein
MRTPLDDAEDEAHFEQRRAELIASFNTPANGNGHKKPEPVEP